jgi:hypothetical protein
VNKQRAKEGNLLKVAEAPKPASPAAPTASTQPANADAKKAEVLAPGQ